MTSYPNKAWRKTIFSSFICMFNYFILSASSLYYPLSKLLQINFTIVSLGSKMFSENVTEFEE